MFGDKYEDKDADEWPTDDLPGEFEVDEEFKSVEEYVGEYDY